MHSRAWKSELGRQGGGVFDCHLKAGFWLTALWKGGRGVCVLTRSFPNELCGNPSVFVSPLFFLFLVFFSFISFLFFATSTQKKRHQNQKGGLLK